VGIKITSLKIKLRDEGIQEVLKSDKIREDLLTVANQLKDKLDAMDLVEEPWDVQIMERSKRLVAVVSTDDPDYKYKEMKHKTVRDFMAASKLKGKK
jgi:hypothetical protein